jgi:hypothetical protein
MIEEQLTGGNVSAEVVRVGNAVRRPSAASTPFVNAFLQHLEREGFEHAPRYLGTDDEGRQLLSWVPGEMRDALGPVPLDGLASIGAVARQLHDVSVSFVVPEGAVWNVPIPPDRHDLIVHHDLAPWNLVVDGDRITFIDWDGVGPGSRLWDLSYAAHGFAVIHAEMAVAEVAGRLAALVDGYGLDRAGRMALVPMLARRTRSMYDLLAAGDRDGVQPWARLFAEGHGEHWGGVTRYLAQHESEWARALGVG